MPTFEITTPKGTFEVDAPDEQTAIQALAGEGVLPDPAIEAQAQAQADNEEKLTGQSGAGQLFGNSFVFGMKDKVAGLAGGVGGMLPGGQGFKQGYNVSRRAQEIIEERARQRTGNAGTAAEIAGSVGTGAILRAPQAASWLGRIGQTAKETGKLGLLQGIGDSEKDTFTGVGTDALTSGVIGAGVGGVLGTGIEVGRGAVKAGQSIVRGLGSVADDAPGRAGRKVVQSFVDDGVTPQQAAARMSTRDTALINTGDENVLGLGRAAAAKPGEGRKILTKAMDAQQKGSQGKVLSAVNDSLGGGDMPFNTRLAKMIETRSANAEKMYEPAFKRNFGADHVMAFDDIARRLPGEAVKNAQRIAHAEGRPFGEQLIASIADDGGVTFKRSPSLREWHYIQRGLRASKDAAYKNGVGEVGTAYNRLHKQLLDAMDTASPMYKSARKAYSSQSDMLDALKKGREILNPQSTKNVDLLADEISSMSASEREMMQIGLARQMEDMLQATPDAAGDMVKKIFGNQAKRSAIRAAFGNDTKFRAFEAKMANAAKEAKSFQYIRTGSRTSIVDAEKAGAGMASEVGGAVMDATTGGVGNVTMNVLGKMLKNVGGMDDAVAAEVAKILVSKDPAFVIRALSPSMRRQGGQAARGELMRRASEIVRAISAGGGSTAAADYATAY